MLFGAGKPPPVRLLDCSESAGSYTLQPGEMGRSLCKFPALAGRPEVVPEVVTVVIEVDDPPAGGPSGIIVARPSATLLYGVGGVSSSVEIDVPRGVTLALPASSLEVLGNNDPIPATIGANTSAAGRAIVMGASAAYGNLTHPPPTRTRYMDAISAAGQSFAWALPKKATTVTLLRYPDDAGVSYVVFTDEANNFVGRVTVPASSVMAETKIPGDARFVTVQLPAGTQVARLVFGLSIG